MIAEHSNETSDFDASDGTIKCASDLDTLAVKGNTEVGFKHCVTVIYQWIQLGAT